MAGKKKNQVATEAKASANSKEQTKDNGATEKPSTAKRVASRWRSHGSKSTDESQSKELSGLRAKLTTWRPGRRGSADQVSNRQQVVPESPGLQKSPLFESVGFKEIHSRRRNTTPTGMLASGISIVLQNAFMGTKEVSDDSIPNNNNNGTGGGKTRGKENSPVTSRCDMLSRGNTIIEEDEGADGHDVTTVRFANAEIWESIDNTENGGVIEDGGWYTAEHLFKTKYSSTSKPVHRPSYRKAIQKAGYNMNDLALSNSPSISPMTPRKMEPKSKVDWTEASILGEHIWAPSNQAGDLCYVGEQLCLKSGPRKKCSACHIIVHDACLDQLDKIGFQCKVTYREASTRNLRENLIVRHHWVHRRRQEGKCKHCGKVFEKRFGFRDSKILAISCSWCKEAYHNKVSCFRMQKIHEACTLGVHARIIVPPTWIVKWTPRGKSLRNRSKKKRSSGMWRKKSSKEGRQRLFVIRPLPEHTPYLSPTLVFINPKSGGNQGVKMLQTFQWLLNQRQVFNLSEGGPKEALEMFRKVPNLRILACGGDGTVGWILSVLDEMNLSRWPPVAILPLGTGNDLSRTLNWGSGYTDEPISKILHHVEEGKVVQVDRWKLQVQPNQDAKQEEDEPPGATADVGVDQLPLNVVNNYFSLGADAKVVLEFHESREAHPSKFKSRFGNKVFYAKTGVTDYLTQKHKNLGKSVSIVCDGKNITEKIQTLKPVCIVFLNIPRYSAGTQPWGNPAGLEFKPQLHDDKLIEVIGFTSNQLGLLYVGGHGERICQCREAVITTSRSFPVQIDGEPCRLNPSIIRLSFHNQANMVLKTKRGSMPLIPDLPMSEQLKICINLISIEQYEKHNGDKQTLRQISRPSHTTVVPADADLETVRLSVVERLQQQDTEKGQVESRTDQYTFLDLSTTADRFYRIDRTQESLHLVREVATSDGELFVLETTLVASKSQDVQTILEPIVTALDQPTLSQFPRSQLVDRATRRRIQSDTTGSTLLQHSIAPMTPRLTPSVEVKERSKTTINQFELMPRLKSEKRDTSTQGDIIEEDDVTMENNELENNGSHNPKTPTGDEKVEKLLSASCGDRDEAKRNSLPSSLTKRESSETIQARPLSTSCDVINDVRITKISSKQPQHCDIIKAAESYGSVFSSPPSSRQESPKEASEPDLTMTDEPSPQPSSNDECLIITESGDASSPTITMTTSSDVAMETAEATVTATPPSPIVTSPTENSSTDSPKSGSQNNSPNSPAHEKLPTLLVEDPELLTQHLLSRKSETRCSVTTMPSPKKQSPEVKKRSNTTAGMTLTSFVKTQTPPPTEKLISPIKRRATTHPSASKNRALTLNEFVTTLKDEAISVAMTTDQVDSQSEPTNDNQSNNRESINEQKQKLNKIFVDASKRGDLSKLKLALESGADPSLTDSDGSTALHNAARFNHPEVVQFLIKNGPPELLNQTDKDRLQTPLHKAAWFGHKKVCELLVDAGASLTLPDYKGMTPLQRAQQAEDVKLEAFLSQEAVKRMQNILLNEDKETKL
ncbi:uncharacterized protein LOC120335722 isoform X2 [Styela clava]